MSRKKTKGQTHGFAPQILNFEAYRQERGQRDELRNFFYSKEGSIFAEKVREYVIIA